MAAHVGRKRQGNLAAVFRVAFQGEKVAPEASGLGWAWHVAKVSSGASVFCPTWFLGGLQPLHRNVFEFST
jgi:hypothetical protein